MSSDGNGQPPDIALHDHVRPVWRGQEVLIGLNWLPSMPDNPPSQLPPFKKLRLTNNLWCPESQQLKEIETGLDDKNDPIIATPAPQTPIKVNKPKIMARPANELAYNKHAYAVWWHPACEDGFDYRGVHSGGTHAWDFIQSWLPKGQYEGSKVRLRRFPDTDAAIQGYGEECRHHKAPDMPQMWQHWNGEIA